MKIFVIFLLAVTYLITSVDIESWAEKVLICASITAVILTVYLIAIRKVSKKCQ